MRAFHFYIDDWLSSKHVRRMDAAEERGYLRLILHAASEPDCGLPIDADELADISLLGAQWSQATQEVSKRFRDQTSGEKLLHCFFYIQEGQLRNPVDGSAVVLDPRHDIDVSRLKEGRFYNQRLLKEFQYQQSQVKQRSEAGKRSAEVRGKAPQEPSEDTPATEGWNELTELAAKAQMSMDPDPGSDLCQKYWRYLSLEDRHAAIQGLRKRIESGQFDDPQYVPTLENYLRGKKWRESLRIRAGPKPVSQAHELFRVAKAKLAK